MKKTITLLFLLIFLLIGIGIVGAHHNRLPGNTWTTGQQVQNNGANSTNVQLVAYNLLGDEYLCLTRFLNPGKSFTYLSDGGECNNIPVGFHGSGVVRADQSLAVIVTTANRGFGSAAGQYIGTNVTNVATTITFPLVKNDHAGRTTTFFVQNTSDNPNNLTAEFKLNGNVYPINFNNIPAKAIVIINPNDADNIPSGLGAVGALTVNGTHPVAGVSLEHETIPTGEPANMQASRAFVPGDFGENLFCPLVRYRFASKLATTGIQVQNVGTKNINITVNYDINVGSADTNPVTEFSVGPGASANFLQQDHFNEHPNDSPRGTLGSATITAENSDGDETTPVLLAAIVNDKTEGTTPERVTTYACFNKDNATPKINLPLVKELFYGNTSGIQVQNLDDLNSTHLTLTYQTNTGKTVVIGTNPATYPGLAPGASKTFVHITDNNCTADSTIYFISGSCSDFFDIGGRGTVSGVVVESVSAQKIVAIVNEAAINGVTDPQDTKNYEGFNQ